MQDLAARTPSAETGRSSEVPRELGGYTATFHFPDGSRLVIAVADAVAFSCGGGDSQTRLEVQGTDRVVLARGNLVALLRKAGIG